MNQCNNTVKIKRKPTREASPYGRYTAMQIFFGFPLALVLMAAGFALTQGLDMVGWMLFAGALLAVPLAIPVVLLLWFISYLVKSMKLKRNTGGVLMSALIGGGVYFGGTSLFLFVLAILTGDNGAGEALFIFGPIFALAGAASSLILSAALPKPD